MRCGRRSVLHLVDVADGIVAFPGKVDELSADFVHVARIDIKHSAQQSVLCSVDEYEGAEQAGVDVTPVLRAG